MLGLQGMHQESGQRSTLLPPLLGTATLPSAGSTRQRPFCTRQRTLSKESVGKELFAEYQISGTRQRFCRVPSQHSAKKTTTVNLTASLPRVDVAGTRQRIFFFFLKNSLTSADPGTRQRGLLCRVSRGRHSAKNFFFFF